MKSIHHLQAFIPKPAYTQVPFALAAGTKVFKKNPTVEDVAAGVVDITLWLAINIIPSVSNLTRYFNGDTTKTRTVVKAQDNIILIHPDVNQITISGTDASVEVEGM